MQIKKILFGIYFLSSLAFIIGCNKTLQETPYSFLSTATFYKDGDEATAAVNGIYNAFWGYGLIKQSYWLIDLDCDHAYGAEWFLGNIGEGNPAGFWGINNIWADHYLVISRANAVLENIEKASMDDDLKNRLKGEAYFLRGWSYYDLACIYGGVPLHIKTLAGGDEAEMPRSTVLETFEQAISDFKMAEQLLFVASDSRSGEKGRVTKGVAQAFLAKAYLTLASGSLKGASISVRGGSDNASYTYQKDVVAGYEGLDSKAYFDSAKTECEKVINSGEYTLFPNYMDMWTVANRNQTEWMWEIQALAGNSNLETNLYYYFNCAPSDRSYVGACWMSDNHYNEYEHQDTRILNGVAHQYIVDYGTPQYTNYILYPEEDTALYKTDAQGNVFMYNGTYYDRAYSNKFSYVNDPGTSYSDNYFPMLRYADVLLMYAEADNEINGGPTDDAYKYLNMIRTRSKASPAPANMSQQDFRSFVFAERGREFTFEAKRRYDLLRWGVYLQVMNKLGVMKQGQDALTKVRTSRNLLFPISTDEVNTNRNLGGNNPGW